MNKYWIVVFRDGSIQFSGRVPTPSHYQTGARFFECLDTTTVDELVACALQNWQGGFPATIKLVPDQPAVPAV